MKRERWQEKVYTPTVVPKVVRIVVVCGVVVVVAGGGGGGALLRSQGVAVGLSVPVKKRGKGVENLGRVSGGA